MYDNDQYRIPNTLGTSQPAHTFDNYTREIFLSFSFRIIALRSLNVI